MFALAALFSGIVTIPSIDDGGVWGIKIEERMIVVLTLLAVASALTPALQTTISPAAMNYVATFVLPSLVTDLRNAQIPNQVRAKVLEFFFFLVRRGSRPSCLTGAARDI